MLSESRPPVVAVISEVVPVDRSFTKTLFALDPWLKGPVPLVSGGLLFRSIALVAKNSDPLSRLNSSNKRSRSRAGRWSSP